MQLTLEQKSEVYERVEHFVNLGNEKLGSDLEKPYVKFDKRGRCGGTAMYRERDGYGELDFNAGLMVDNWDEYMNQVIPHEVAHLLKEHIYGPGKGMKAAHGYYWQSVMRTLGVKPDRTHKMDTSKVRMAPRTKTKHIYMCPCCKQEFVISQVRHNRMLRGRTYRHCVGDTIKYVRTLGKISNREAFAHKNANTAPAPEQRKAAVAKKAKAPAKGTKIAHAMLIYKTMLESVLTRHHTRQSIIAAISESMQITPHQAAGYYQNCKKRIG